MKKRNSNLITNQEDINFYIENAKMLASSFDEQYKNLGALDDYITEDIASDWIWQNLKVGIFKMLDENLISEYVVNLFKKIGRNFSSVSFGNQLFEERIWTLEGLKNHSFWVKQRNLARELLNQLNSIDILNNKVH